MISPAQLKEIFQSFPDNCVLLKPDLPRFNIIEVNRSFEEITGIKVKHDIIGEGSVVDLHEGHVKQIVGGTLSVVGLMFLAPLLAQWAIRFVDLSNTARFYERALQAFYDSGADPWSVPDWFTGQPGNAFMNPMLDGIFPPANAAYLSGFPLDPEMYDDFFDDVDYIGAFRSRAAAWIWNWTEFLDD